MTATCKILREKADACLGIIEEIKRDYKKDPNGTQYDYSRDLLSAVLSSRGVEYKAVFLTSEDKIVFAVEPRKGICLTYIACQALRPIGRGFGLKPLP